MAAFWIGTTGYAHAEWRGSFYPLGLQEGQELAAYAQRFATVEINSSASRPPSMRQIQSWVRETPTHFRFALKAPRAITHELRLLDAGELVSDFCASLRPLQQRLGPLLIQLPPYQKRDLARLEDFLHQLPANVRYALEFRHPSWFTDLVFDTLRRFGVALCVAEREELVTPFVITAPFLYLRLRGRSYPVEELARWRDRLLAALPQATDCFVYFKLPAAVETLEVATRFAGLLAEERSPARCGDQG